MNLEEKANQLLAEFEKEARVVLEEFCSLPSDSLYHYTSFSNFQRIINDGQLCFTDYRHLNDPTEILLSQTVFQEVLEGEYKDPLGALSKWGFNLLKSMIDSKHFNANKDDFKEIESLQYDIYTFSFCSQRDYLPLWRWYGGDGAGISIGFRANFFKSVDNDNLKANPREPKAVYITIDYDKEKFQARCKKILDFAKNVKINWRAFCVENNISRGNSEEVGVNLLCEIELCIITHLLPLMPGFKHHGYKDEHEHRLYYTENKTVYKPELKKDSKFWPFDEISKERKKTRPGRQKEGCCLPLSPQNIHYITHPILLDDINEIWIGSCLHFECAKEQIIKLLAQKGYDLKKLDTDEGIKIRKSEAPYQ